MGHVRIGRVCDISRRRQVGFAGVRWNNHGGASVGAARAVAEWKAIDGFVITYCVLLVVLSIYGIHRIWMVGTFLRDRRPMLNQSPRDKFDDLPRVTIQLPMFNEPNVAERVIEAACRIDYPRDRLQIQVLDDSTDSCADIARACCDRLRAQGHDIEYVHRSNRGGYKAGALAHGLGTATGEFIGVFDADFVPPSSFLHETIHHFTDKSVGMVQTCWNHLNRDRSILTRVQAMFLDGHFIVEQTVRAANDRWFNFNGTAGIWRRDCIDEAGGWRHDTLTEDTDLSYRAQLAGWEFRYLPNVRCAAEIPPTLSGFLSQQHRWNKGLVETGIKLLPRILRADIPAYRKIEAWFHLTSPMLYLAVLLMSVLLPASLLAGMINLGDDRPAWLLQGVLWSGLACLVLGTGAVALFYLVSQWARGESMLRALLLVPLLLAIGVGTSVVNTGAVIGALLRRKTPFIRTPKFNTSAAGPTDPASSNNRRASHLAGSIELLLGLALITCIAVTIDHPPLIIGLPFAALFICGFLWIGAGRLIERFRQAT